MKRLSILLALWVCATTNAVAQYPYTHRIDAVAKEITYEVTRVLDKRLYLNNIANVLDNELIVWTDGTVVEENDYLSLKLGELNTGSVYRAIRETFTESEYHILESGKDWMDVLFVIDPCGKILEVDFTINVSPRTEAISPDKYALFEQNLKKYVTYSITEDMARLQFWRTYHRFDFASLGILYKNQDPGIALPDSLQVNP